MANPSLGLSPREYAFCLAYVKHNVGARAYREAYQYQGKAEYAAKRSGLLLKKPLIRAAIEKLKDPVLQESKMSLEAHLDNLRAIRDKALQEKVLRIALDAEIKRGEAAGFYVERSESGKPGEFEELSEAQLRQKITADRQAAEELRRIQIAAGERKPPPPPPVEIPGNVIVKR